MNIGLIFGMIVAIFMIALILVFGYEQIAGMTDIQETAAEKSALKRLQDAVDNVYGLSGESSDKVTLSYPGSIRKVCFVPYFKQVTVSGTLQRKPYTASEMKNKLKAIIDGTAAEKTQLSTALYDTRLHNQTLVLFYEDSGAPVWKSVEHMGPVEKGGQFLCTDPGASMWLQRKFDSKGAWVDVSES
jgi:hypothetical protein